MAEEIHPSSYRCDCGHESHFFESTVREAKMASQKRELRLSDSCENEHTIVFFKGEVVSIKCPERGVLTLEKPVGDQNDLGKLSDPAKKQSFEAGEKVIWLKRIPGGTYVYPVKATVLAMTAKRIKIEADDENETAIRYVPAASLQKRK